VGHQLDREAVEQELQEARGPLDEWRRLATGPKRIPEPIWERATELAIRHGVGVVAAGLRLDHSKLKGKVAAVSPVRADKKAMMVTAPRQPQPVGASFVELFGTTTSASSTPSTTTCVLQVESSRGSRLRMEVGGLDAPGLALLLKEFA
jgi:hypothetical protein